MGPTELAYRRTALSGASGFSLLIALYDTLAGDLRRAAQAERNGDIEQRSRQVNHALLIVGLLEEWIDRGTGGELAAQLRGFYQSLRGGMIEAQAKRSPELLEEDMARVLEIREVWQKAESRGTTSAVHVPGWVQTPAYPASSLPMRERNPSRWSA
jgi:flagellar protein FliS